MPSFYAELQDMLGNSDVINLLAIVDIRMTSSLSVLEDTIRSEIQTGKRLGFIVN